APLGRLVHRSTAARHTARPAGRCRGEETRWAGGCGPPNQAGRSAPAVGTVPRAEPGRTGRRGSGSRSRLQVGPSRTSGLPGDLTALGKEIELELGPASRAPLGGQRVVGPPLLVAPERVLV